MADNSEKEDKVKKTNSGVEKEGELEEVAEFAEEVEEAIKTEGMDDGTVKEFDEWRPKKDEDDKKLRDKTVKSAVKEEEKIEENFDGVKKDLNRAGKEAEKVPKKVKKGQKPNKEVRNISLDLIDPFVAYGAKIMKWVEINVYKKFMLRFNDLYFNSEDLSADLRRKRTGKYDLDINIKNEDKRDDVTRDVEEMEEK